MSGVRLGDANLDGQVGEQDLIRLIQHLTGESPLTGNGLRAADTNCDGQVNEQDLIRLIQHLTGEKPLPERCPEMPLAMIPSPVVPSRDRIVQVGQVEMDNQELLIPITIDEANGIAALGLTVAFDPEQMDIVEVINSDLVPEGFAVYFRLINPGELKVVIVPPVESPVPILNAGAGRLLTLRAKLRDVELMKAALESLALKEVRLSDSEGLAIGIRHNQ